MKTYILKQQLSSVSYLFSSIFIAFIYLIVLIFLLNTKIFLNILSLPLTLAEKTKIISLMFLDSTIHLPLPERVLFLLISLLVGLNLELMRQKLDVLKKRRMKITFGVGIISLVGAGCTACGISILSILGIGFSAGFLPFKGVEFSVFALLILLVTFYYSISSLAAVCRIPTTSGKTRKKTRSSR